MRCHGAKIGYHQVDNEHFGLEWNQPLSIGRY